MDEHEENRAERLADALVLMGQATEEEWAAAAEVLRTRVEFTNLAIRLLRSQAGGAPGIA